MNTTRIDVWTDGSSSGNPGPAGWAVLVNGELISDWEQCATNNEMETFAIYQAVANCPFGAHLVVRTDSKLAIGWMSKGYVMRKPNIQAIVKAYMTVKEAMNLTVEFVHVHGHAGLEENEKVNRAAVAQSRRARSILEAQTAHR